MIKTVEKTDTAERIEKAEASKPDLWHRFFDTDFPSFFEFPRMGWLDMPWMREMRDLRMEEWLDGDTMFMRLEMPGIDPDRDAEITLAHGMVTVKVERKQEEKASPMRTEFRYGSFTRSFSVPATVTERDVSASYKDGILELRIHMPTGEPMARKVMITKA